MKSLISSENPKKLIMESFETRDTCVALRVDNADSSVFQAVNCMERIAICKGIRCKLRFPLNQDEVENGVM